MMVRKMNKQKVIELNLGSLWLMNKSFIPPDQLVLWKEQVQKNISVTDFGVQLTDSMIHS